MGFLEKKADFSREKFFRVPINGLKINSEKVGDSVFLREISELKKNN